MDLEGRAIPDADTEDRTNLKFAAWLQRHQRRVRPRLTQSEWARMTGAYYNEPKGITTAYLNRILRYPELLAQGSENRIKRPRPVVVIAIVKVLEDLLREQGLVEEALRSLGYSPAFHLGLSGGETGEGEVEALEIGRRVLGLADEDRQIILRMLERMEGAASADA